MKIRSLFTHTSKRSAQRGGLGFRDISREALEGVAARPSRLLITLLGTVLGIASLVTTIGFSQTASGQIAQKFDALAATRVVVEPGKAKTGGDKTVATATLPWDAVQRVTELAGVSHAALIADLPQGLAVKAGEVEDPSEAAEVPPQVIASTPELLDTVDGTMRSGRFFDYGHDQRAERVVVLGERAAEGLGINRLSHQPAIFIGEHTYTVIGILGEVGTKDALLDEIIIPMNTARTDLDLIKPEKLEIRITVGAGKLVAHQAPIALNPNAPDGFEVAAPSDTSDLQKDVEGDVNMLFIAIGIVALLGGGIGIANVTLLAVSERRTEIGLRRALGARTKDIAKQFMCESLITGLLGGLIGVSIGIFALVGVCLLQQWTPVLAPWVPPAGVLIGAGVGLIAGSYPALKAARIEPVDALRDS